MKRLNHAGKRYSDREYFYAALDRHFPEMKQKYIKKFGYSYECTSDNNNTLMKIFHSESEKHAVMHDIGQIFEYFGTYPQSENTQLSLF